MVRKIKKITYWFLTFLVMFITCLPGIWIFISAFRPNAEILSKPANWFPDNWTIHEFTQMFSIKGYVSVPAFDYLMNSVIISLTSTVIAITIGMMGGYAFARFNFKGKNTIFLGLMLARAVPGISLSLPLFILWAKLGLINTSFGVIIVYVAMNVPFTIWLTDGFFRQIPKEMSEVARTDGCTRLQAFWNVELPLAGPGIAAAGIFAFLLSWNEYALASVLTRTIASKTLPIGMMDYLSEFTINWAGMCAIAVVMIVPAVILTFIVQKHLVSGLTFGDNGFYLEYKGSGTSANASGMGADTSGNTSHFTVNNLTAVDQSTDTCTNNFATLNSIDSFSSGATFSEGNTTVVSTNGGRGIMTATVGLTSGKWYWEVKNSASGGTHSGDEWNHIGISNRAAANADNILAESGTNSNKVYEYTYYAYDGNHYNNGDQGGYGASFTTNDIVGVFLDLDNNKIYWSKNGAWADGSGNSDENDPNGFKAVTDPASTPGGVYIPACGDGGVNVFKTWQWNFGGTPGFAVSSSNADPNGYGNFEYPTEGGYAICSKNLAEFGG